MEPPLGKHSQDGSMLQQQTIPSNFSSMGGPGATSMENQPNNQSNGPTQEESDPKLNTGMNNMSAYPQPDMNSYHRPPDGNMPDQYGQQHNYTGMNQTDMQRSGMGGPSDPPSSMPSRFTHPSQGPPQSVATPTLNQLLTQSGGKMAQGNYPGGDFKGPAMNPGGIYDQWGQGRSGPMYPPSMGQMRPQGGPPQNKMGPGGMYERSGMPPSYRPHATGIPPSGMPFRRPPYPHMDSAGNEDISHSSQRPRHSLPGGVMGPPRPPGSHQMDSSGQMMPPPGQGYPGYPGGPYGGQQFRPQNPYAAFPPNQSAPSGPLMNRMPQPGAYPGGPPANYPSQQMNSPQVNGPSKAGMPPSPSQHGMSPVPSHLGMPPSPAQRGPSPCPSPSVNATRSHPASPAAQNSPHPGQSPRPERSTEQVSPSPQTEKMEESTNQVDTSRHSPAVTSVSNDASSQHQQTGALHDQQQNQQAQPQQQMPSSHQMPPSHPMPGQQQMPNQPQMGGPQSMPNQQQMGGPQSMPNQQQMGGPQSMANPQQMGGLQSMANPQQMGGLQPMANPQQMGGPQSMPNQQQMGGPQSLPNPQQMGGPLSMPNQQPMGGPQSMPNQQQMGGPQSMPNQQQMGGPQSMPNQQQIGGPQSMLNQQQMGGPQSIPNQQPMGGPQSIPNQQQMGGPQSMPNQMMMQGMPGQPNQSMAGQQQRRMMMGMPNQPHMSRPHPGMYPGQGQYPPNSQQSYPGQYPQSSNGAWGPPEHQRGMMHPKMDANSARSSPMPASPHGTMSPADPSRRPSSRKSSIAASPGEARSPGWPGNSKKVPPGPPAPGTLHGSTMEVVNKQLGYGEEPMRKPFLDHLCMFYHETGCPLTQNPTMGKHGLDLWKCYTQVKEKGGFQQVCKKKQWKQIGSMLVEGATTNVAFTLKKAYIKYLLNYECRFERGGADPQAVLAAIDTKKDKSRTAPSPAGSGNSNSQDSFMRGYPGEYPMPGPMGPSGPHPNMGGPMHPGQHMPGQYPDHSMGPEQQPFMGYNNMGPGGMANGHPPPPTSGNQNQPMGPADKSQVNDQQQMNGSNVPYGNMQPNMGAAGYGGPRQSFYGPRMPPPFQQPGNQLPQHPAAQNRMRMPGPPQSQPGYPPMYNARDTSSYPQNQGPAPSPIGGHMMPDRRHPAMYSQSGPTGNSPMPHSSESPAPPNQMRSYPPRPGFPPSSRGALSAMLSTPQGDYLSNHSVTYTESLCNDTHEMPPPPPPVDHGSTHDQRQMGSSPSPWRRRPQGPPPGYSADSKRPMPPGAMNRAMKKEIVFPSGCVESRQPAPVKRRVLYGKDIGKVDPWRLVMCLRSGLLCESIWALDTLTVLLHDDSTVLYFSLANMPGLLDALIKHYKQSLASTFEEFSDLMLDEGSTSPTRSHHSDSEDADISDKEQMLRQTNFSWVSRGGTKVIVDYETKPGKRIPTPSMYSKALYVCESAAETCLGTFESANSIDTLRRQFLRRAKTDRKMSSVSLPESDGSESEPPSPVPTSPTSGGTEFSALSEKRIASDPTSQIPICNGEHANELSTDSSDPGAKKIKMECEEVTVAKTPAPHPLSSDVKLELVEAKLCVSRKRKFSDCIDDEPTIRDHTPLECDVDLRQEELANRCVTLANILRGLSCIPTNEKILAACSDLLDIVGRVLNIHLKVDAQKDERSWWWSAIDLLREHTLVTLSNIAGHIELMPLSDEICYPLMDSLLFWATSPAAYVKDNLPTSTHLSAQNLVMECFSKMCSHSNNIDLLLATPPWERMMKLFGILAEFLNSSNQVHREFALVVVSCLAQADPTAARGLALQPSCVSSLIGLLESAESAALSIAHQRGVSALRDNPDAMGTSLDMIRRTSATLVQMSLVPENRSILLRQHDRLLNLVMSQILDQHVAKMLSDVLFESQRDAEAVPFLTEEFPPPTPEPVDCNGENNDEKMESDPVTDVTPTTNCAGEIIKQGEPKIELPSAIAS